MGDTRRFGAGHAHTTKPTYQRMRKRGFFQLVFVAAFLFLLLIMPVYLLLRTMLYMSRTLEGEDREALLRRKNENTMYFRMLPGMSGVDKTSSVRKRRKEGGLQGGGGVSHGHGRTLSGGSLAAPGSLSLSPHVAEFQAGLQQAARGRTESREA